MCVPQKANCHYAQYSETCIIILLKLVLISVRHPFFTTYFLKQKLLYKNKFFKNSKKKRERERWYNLKGAHLILYIPSNKNVC